MAALSSRLIEELENGTLLPPEELKLKRWSNELLRKRFTANCQEMLTLFARQGILATDANAPDR